MNKLVKIQTELHAPKGQRNNFGNYNYRSCEDILTALKPLLKETECHLIISDDIVMVGSRTYVKATATLYDGDKIVATASAFAREAEMRKGMDESQVTGSASSYARKYALNGLFGIDDNKDADTMDNSDRGDITQVDRDIHAEIKRLGKCPDGMVGWEKAEIAVKINYLSRLKATKELKQG